MGKKVLIIGSSGMAGHMIYGFFKSNKIDVIGIDCFLSQYVDYIVDLRNKEQMLSFFKSNFFDYIINCAGILGDGIKKDYKSAHYINAELTGLLITFIPKNTKIIHISSDYVFSGRKSKKYSINDVPDNESEYGKQKIVSEVKAPNFLSLRLSMVGPSLDISKNTFFNNLFIKKELIGFTNMKTTLITTLELACFLRSLIETNGFSCGVKHLSLSRKTSKYMIMVSIKKYFYLDCNIQKGKCSNDLDYSLRSSYTTKPLRIQLIELRNYMKNNITYKDYFYERTE